MGCDIHGWVERRVNDKWVAVSQLNDNANQRNYRRFAALAGVRGDGPKPKGIPQDVADTTRLWIENWGEDGHSHSWLPLDEATEIFVSTAYLTKDNVYPISNYPNTYFFDIETDDLSDYRLVFWFDN